MVTTRNGSRSLPGFNVDDRAALSALKADVQNVEGDIKRIETGFTHLSNRFETTVSSLASEMRNSLQSMASKLDSSIEGIHSRIEERQRTPWVAIFSGIGVLVTFMGLFGAMAYSPIREATTDMKQTLADRGKEFTALLQAMPDHYVNYREHDRLLSQIDNQQKWLQDQLVTRGEHLEHWKATEQRESAIESDARARVDAISSNVRIMGENLQRQVDEVKRAQADTWSARDEIQRLQRQQENDAELLRKLLAARGGG